MVTASNEILKKNINQKKRELRNFTTNQKKLIKRWLESENECSLDIIIDPSTEQTITEQEK